MGTYNAKLVQLSWTYYYDTRWHDNYNSASDDYDYDSAYDHDDRARNDHQHRTCNHDYIGRRDIDDCSTNNHDYCDNTCHYHDDNR